MVETLPARHEQTTYQPFTSSPNGSRKALPSSASSLSIQLASPHVNIGTSRSTAGGTSQPSGFNMFVRRGSIVPTRFGKGAEVDTDVIGITRGVEKEKSKEDAALDKWRKWVVEQPLQITIEDRKPQPQQQHLRGPSSTSTQMSIPLVPLSSRDPSSSPTNSSPRLGRAPSPVAPSHSSLLPNSNLNTMSRSSSSSTNTIKTPQVESQPTESTRFLADTELAIDLDLYHQSFSPNTMDGKRRASKMSISTKPRISDRENPFGEVAARMGSRRVRPFVLELIQALGHYLDAVWGVEYPGRLCPWIDIGEASNLSRRSVTARSNSASASPSPSRTSLDKQIPTSTSMTPTTSKNSIPEAHWHSKTLRAIYDARAKELLPLPVERDIMFWHEEVERGLTDVDEVVGIYHGVKFGFRVALAEGEYAEVARDNCFGFPSIETERNANGSRMGAMAGSTSDGSRIERSRERAEKGEKRLIGRSKGIEDEIEEGGGNQVGGMLRLLADLEETLWGDGPPRSTDLSWELPTDFDPYAENDPAEYTKSSSNPFTSTPIALFDSLDKLSPSAHHPLSDSAASRLTVPLRGGSVHLTSGSIPLGTNDDTPRRPETGRSTSEPMTLTSSSNNNLALESDMAAFGIGSGRELSMQEKIELGKRRHNEWLARKQAEGRG